MQNHKYIKTCLKQENIIKMHDFIRIEEKNLIEIV